MGRSLAARVGLVLLVGGCASAQTTSVRIDTPANAQALGFRRLLVAGFLPDGVGQIDINEETARFIRTQLRSKPSLLVIESEPLRLTGMVRPGERAVQPLGTKLHRSAHDGPRDILSLRDDDAVFTNVSFWKTLGEEYSEPLILTGTATFRPAGSRMVERQVGRRTMRFWLPGFTLRLRLILISGSTGEIVDSVALRQRTAHATTGRESALSIYFRLMEQTMPSVLEALGQQTNQTRIHDREAARYDSMIRIPERLLFGDDRIWATSQAIGDVLEIAIGIGRNLPYYAPGVRLTGQDISPAMLEIAQRRARALGRTVDLQVSDAQDMPFMDEQFDSVVSTFSLCTIPDDRRALAEIRRVLRSGGRLILLEHVRSPQPIVRALQHLFEPLANRYAGDHLLREPLDHLADFRFSVEFCSRSRAGIVERLVARKNHETLKEELEQDNPSGNANEYARKGA
jgi:ubiquinone/menaquinone biosynthesis C-methylase UbiE